MIFFFFFFFQAEDGIRDLTVTGVQTCALPIYSRLAEALETSSPERLQALERGLVVSLRDGDLKDAQSFAGLLESAGHVEFQGLLGSAGQAESGTIVPGGLDALAFAAHAQEHVPP